MSSSLDPVQEQQHEPMQQQGESTAGDQKLAAVVAAAEVAASMYDAYQAWALKTYGDSAKTKTVTKKKYNRIMKILKGEESSSVENSKFRFWVKAKGFKIALDAKSGSEVLYVPGVKNIGKQGDVEALSMSSFKKVAVVENFYDIIYNVHVEMDGRSGKHAGQKRTYRAVAEMYAFLPREAVTRFLMSCSDCQKRMHLQYNNNHISNGDQAICPTNEDESMKQRSKSKAVAKICPLIISSSSSAGMNSALYARGKLQDDELDSFGHHQEHGLQMIMEVNENQVYTPRITQEIRKAVKKTKAVTVRKGSGITSQGNSGIKDQTQGKRRASSMKGTTTGNKSASTCKKIRLNNATGNKLTRHKDQESVIKNGQSDEEAMMSGSRAVQWSEMDEDDRDDLEGEEIEEEEMDVSESGCRSGQQIVTTNDSCQDEEEEDDGEERGGGDEGDEAGGAEHHEEGVEEDEVEIDEDQGKDLLVREEDDDDDEGEEEQWIVGDGEEEDEELDEEEIRGIRAKMRSVTPPTTVSCSPASRDSLSPSSSPLDMRKSGAGKQGRNRNLRNGIKSLPTSSSLSLTASTSPSSSSLQNGSSSSGVKKNNCISKKSSSSASNHAAAASSSSSCSTAEGMSGKALDLSPDSKIKTRDQIVAAFSAMNGRNIRTCNSSSNNPRYPCINGQNGHTVMSMLDDEDDDEDEEEGDQMPGSKGESNGTYDPERLKAFNMFVRLFVDENLDRMVPISRQPKDKIQAIIDSCTRQFPEFSERSRKRIRTYLKSCRRTRRHKVPVSESPSSPAAQSTSVTDSSMDEISGTACRAGDKVNKSKEPQHQLSSSAAAAGILTTPMTGSMSLSSSTAAQQPSSPTSSSNEPLITCAQLSSTSSSYHLTSRLAEQILATACDNEFQNAQRIRQGMKPMYQQQQQHRQDAASLMQDHLSESDGDQMLKSGGAGCGKNSLKYHDPTASTFMSAHHPQHQTNGFSITSSSSSSLHHHDQQQISTTVSGSSPAFPTGASSSAAVHILTPAVSAHTTSSSLLAALCHNRSPSDGLLPDSTESNHITRGNATTGGVMNGHKSGRGSNGSSNAAILTDLIENRSSLSSCAAAAAASGATSGSSLASSHRLLPASSPSSLPSSSSIPTTSSSSYGSTNCTGQLQRYTLNPSEMAAVKQLISGYRESAAFLLRSADELEQLLLRQA